MAIQAKRELPVFGDMYIAVFGIGQKRSSPLVVFKAGQIQVMTVGDGDI